MQPPYLLLSRSGTALLRRSTCFYRSCSKISFCLPCLALTTRPYSRKEQQSTFDRERAENDLNNQPSSNRVSNVASLTSARQLISEPPCQQPASGSQSTYHESDNTISDQDALLLAGDSEVRAGQETGCQIKWRLMWRPQKEDSMGGKRMIAEEPNPSPEYNLDDIEFFEASRVVRNRRPLTKTQKAKRANTRIWKQLETVEHQLESVEIQIQGHIRVAKVKKHFGVVGRLLKVIETELELAVKLLKAYERELETIKRRAEAWTELMAVDQQLKSAGRDLDTTTSRMEAKRELVIVEQQLEIVERRLLSARWEMENFRTSVKANTIQRTSNRRRTRRPPISRGFLARWLNIIDVSEREQYWSKNKGRHTRITLPLILVEYLRLCANPNLQLDSFDRSIIRESSIVLSRSQFTAEDLADWAWIVSAQDPKTMTERFISTPSIKPIFLLLEILKRDSLDVRSFKLLLDNYWNQLLQIPGANLTTNSAVGKDSVFPWSTVCTLSNTSPAQRNQPSSFSIILCMLRQARRIWPAAVVSISHMVEPFIMLNLGCNSGQGTKLDNESHALLCKLYNKTLCVLALPSSINPLKSMVYNWQAQRVILGMATHFDPPLILDQKSYRAVARVLAASRKSERESKAAALRTRSWPPWRVDQDGMDAQRSREDDMSRVIVTTNQAKESGYCEEADDQVIRVFGGQEPDGTPTIPTRKLIFLGKMESKRRRGSSLPSQCDPETSVWAARIESTRDVQEAWAAFTVYQEKGLQPSMSMYSAMFAKLHQEGKRIARRFGPESSPGDGQEVLEPSNDNFSCFYQSRLQPPSLDELYEQMRHAGIRPVGRFLNSLVSHARSPLEGMKYLVDGRVDGRALAFLSGERTNFLGGVKRQTQVALKSIHEDTFAAFVKLLCRLAPRLIPATASSTRPDKAEYAEETDDVSKLVGWKLIDLRNKYLNHRLLNPLLHCANLLKISRSRSRPAWYALFAGLVRRGVVVDRSLIGDPRNEIVAWKVLVAALGDFHECGLELDPTGFRMLCIGLEKALLASFEIPEDEREDVLGKDQVGIVLGEFMKLSEVKETSNSPIPNLLHPIEGAHLHAYVRVLGLKQDYDGLIYVLRWMVKYHIELDQIACRSRNGSNTIRRSLIAMKVFLGRTKYGSQAEELVNSVDSWGGWPLDLVGLRYLERGRSGTDWCEREPGVELEFCEGSGS